METDSRQPARAAGKGLVFPGLLKALGTAAFRVKGRLAIYHPGQPARLRAFGDDLAASARDLKTVCAELEKDFLATGVALEKLASHGQKFLKASDALVDSATGQSGGSALLSNAVKLAGEPMAFLDASQPETLAILGRLKQDTKRIDDLICVQVELQQTIGPLKYLQTLFKIESAPLGGDVQAMFGALTKEIETLYDQICELFTTRFQELRAIQHTLNGVVGELQDQTDHLGASITRGKAKIESSLHKMQVELAENQKRHVHINQLSKAVSHEIQKIVEGLQHQDLINQKLQHALASVERLQSKLAAGEVGPSLRQSCELEAGQLQAVRQDLAAAEKHIRTGISRMLEHLAGANSGSLAVAEYNQLATSSDGMVQILVETFATLREQMAGTMGSSARAFEQLRSVGGMASDLTVVVRDLSQRIHLIGLNAQLQAAQVGQRMGLEVLSARTSEISLATNRISEMVARQLDQLVHDLGEDVKALEKLNGEARQQQGRLDQEGSVTEQGLRRMRDSSVAALAEINSLLKEIQAESPALLDSARHVDHAYEVLETFETKLRTLARAVGEMAPKAAGREDLIEHARHGYTMHSERQVFAQVVAGQAPVQSAPEPGGVELFDSPAPAPTPAAAASPEPTPQPIAAPPAPAVVASSPTPVAAPAAKDLGNNVELF